MKISVITVVLNNMAYIADCINSVIGQTYKNYEYIIIDGGSTDGTIRVLEKYTNRISRWISETDQGIYDAMNKGIKLASGDIIGFLNADDVYYDVDVLENIVSVMSDTSIDACYSDLVYVDKNDLNKVVRYWRSDEFKAGFFEKGWVPAHPTFFARKSVYDQYGNFDLNYKLAADFELMARFLEYHKIRVKYIPRVSVKMRIGGATNKSLVNIMKQNFEIFRACRKNDIKISPISFLMNKSITRLRQFYPKLSI
jgi:glycosyltransferase involved in cell wall biosynthesis